jgi:hypothetical protein
MTHAIIYGETRVDVILFTVVVWHSSFLSTIHFREILVLTEKYEVRTKDLDDDNDINICMTKP